MTKNRETPPTGEQEKNADSTVAKKAKKAKKTTKAKSTKKQIKSDKRGIVVQQYNELWAVYLETQNLEECVRRTGLNRKTVEKYVWGSGDPDRGMEPIGPRYKRVMQQVHEDEDYTLMKWRDETFKQTISRVMNILRGDLMIHQAHMKERLDRMKAGHKVIPWMPMDKLVKAMDTAFRMGEHALGGPDQVVESLDNPYKDWTDEELYNLWEMGITPERFK